MSSEVTYFKGLIIFYVTMCLANLEIFVHIILLLPL